MSATERCYSCQDISPAIAHCLEEHSLFLHQVVCKDKCFNVSCPNEQASTCETSKRCKACFAQYCSKVCQQEDRQRHTLICGEIKDIYRVIAPEAQKAKITHIPPPKRQEPARRRSPKASESPITPKLMEMYRTRAVAKASATRDIGLCMTSFRAALACMEVYAEDAFRRDAKTYSLQQAHLDLFRSALTNAETRLQLEPSPEEKSAIIIQLNAHVAHFMKGSSLPPSLS